MSIFKRKKPIMGCVYAGPPMGDSNKPAYPDNKIDSDTEMNEVYAGPEMFEQEYPYSAEEEDYPVQAIYAAPEYFDPPVEDEQEYPKNLEESDLLNMRFVYAGPDMMIDHRCVIPDDKLEFMAIYAAPAVPNSPVYSDENSADNDACASPEFVKSDIKDGIACPACSWMNAKDRKFCENCGAILKDDTRDV